MTVEPSSTGASSPSPLDRVLVLGLGAAVVYGALARGGFYIGEGFTVLLLVAVATAARIWLRRPTPSFVVVSAAALLGFATWSGGSALLYGGVHAALPTAALACGLAAALWSAAGLDASARRVLQAVVLASAVVVAFTGWLGVVLHVEPLVLRMGPVLRAASTLTYMNATAAFLVTALLLAVAVLLPNRRRLALLTVSALLLGLVITMSRAGLLTLVLGILVLLASDQYRARLLSLWPVVPATAAAAVGLLPALPAAAGPQPLPALAGILAGLAILLLERRTVLLAVGLVLGSVLGAVMVVASASTLERIASLRITLTDPTRIDVARVTAAQFLASPLTGVGPGRLDLVYVDHKGRLVHAEYTHNEYLQTAAETGMVGLALVVTALGALALAAALRWRTTAGPPVLALVTAFAVHSAFDFLWHIPVLPLLVVVCAVPLMSQQGRQHGYNTQDRHRNRAGGRR